jgi:hypothetical protein
MHPGRIVKKPVRKFVGRVSHIFVSCDDGKTYDIADLAKIIGMTRSGLYTRIRMKGWKNPHILAAPAVKGRCINGAKTGRKLGGGSGKGSEEWERMSSRPRTYNLLKIRPLWTFEQQG